MASEPAARDRGDTGSGNPATVERVVVVDPADGATTVYEGTFPFLRDGGTFEVTIPVGTEPVPFGPPIETGPLPDRAIETLSEREGPLTDEEPEHFLVCPLPRETFASGRVTVVAASDETLVIAVDDADYADPPLDLTLGGEDDE